MSGKHCTLRAKKLSVREVRIEFILPSSRLNIPSVFVNCFYVIQPLFVYIIGIGRVFYIINIVNIAC